MCGPSVGAGAIPVRLTSFLQIRSDNLDLPQAPRWLRTRETLD